MRDIIKTEYDGRKCKGFQYILELDNKKKCRLIFMAVDEECKEWSLCCLIPDSFSERERSVGFMFSTPKGNMPLTTICTIGLNLLQRMIQEEVQIYTGIDSLVGCLVRGET